MKTNICQAVFGKRKRDLSPDELVIFQRLARSANHYRHHEASTRRLRERAQEKKRLVLDALGWPAACIRCGYDRYIGALDFHHLDAALKDDDVLTFGLTRAIEEARKCQLICANCHRETHAADVRGGAGRPRVDNPLLEKYLAAAGITR